MEEVGTRSGELVATDESTVISKPRLDAIVMEDGQGDGCLANPSSTYESDRTKVFRKADDFSNQFIASETGPWSRGRGFPRIDAKGI